MEAALPALLAERILLDKGHRSFMPETLYKLVLQATGSVEAADTAAADREQQIMDEKDQQAGA
jgi:hypothetical protein